MIKNQGKKRLKIELLFHIHCKFTLLTSYFYITNGYLVMFSIFYSNRKLTWQEFKQFWTIRYIFPTIQIVGRIVQMYTDLQMLYWNISYFKKAKLFTFTKYLSCEHVFIRENERLLLLTKKQSLNKRRS